MKLNRKQLILAGTGLILFVLLCNSLFFICRAGFAKGEIIYIHEWFTGYRYRGRTTQPVVRFSTEVYEVTFGAETNLNYYLGESVKVIYLKSRPTHAMIFTFWGFWIPAFKWGMIPFMILTAAATSFMRPNDILLISLKRPVKIKRSNKIVGFPPED